MLNLREAIKRDEVVMPKNHSQARVVENKGIARFHSFCANHQPAITWRPVTNDDIGIDGEIELYDNDGTPLAEIIKVQLKSTERDKSYIRNENKNNGTFTFYAERSHVEYWQKLANDVLLVIYDNRDNQNRLYAKKVENIDLRDAGVESVPIKFNQAKDSLDDNHEFLQRFSRLHNPSNPTIKRVVEGTETLITNLMKVTFPTNKIYVAPVNYDRDEIIRDSWNTDRPLGHKAKAREVARSALHQKGLNFSSDWTIYNKQIITFHNLNDSDIPLSQIVEAPIDEFTPRELYTVENYKDVFKALLRFCLQQKLYKIGYEWQNDEEVFRSVAPLNLKDGLEVKEEWRGEKKATRTIFKASFYEKFKVHYCQHFAFEVDIKEFDDEWFFCINPTWIISIDGRRKSQVSYKRVKALKRLERNKSVYNHLRYIAFKLLHGDLYSLEHPLLASPKYRFLDFHPLEQATIEKVIDDNDWLHKEDEDEKNKLEDAEEVPESKGLNIKDDENTLF